jgi:hypothetical protein
MTGATGIVEENLSPQELLGLMSIEDLIKAHEAFEKATRRTASPPFFVRNALTNEQNRASQMPVGQYDAPEWVEGVLTFLDYDD